MSALPHSSNTDFPGLGFYHCLSMSYCPLTPNCWAPASLLRLTWKLNELGLQQWEQCLIFRAKQGTVVLTAPLLGRPFVTQCFLLRVEAVAGVNLKSKITFSFENTADMPSQQGSVSSLSLYVLCFMKPKIYHSNGVKFGDLSSI